jgi:paraquat-inducible protein B
MTAAKPAVIGAFVLGGLGLGVVAILMFGGGQFFTRTVHAVAYFQGSVAGLEVGAPVTFRGVRVGAVTRIAVNLNLKDLTARIPVYLDLKPSQVSLEDTTPGQRRAPGGSRPPAGHPCGHGRQRYRQASRDSINPVQIADIGG